MSVASLRVPQKAWDHYQKALAAEKTGHGRECDAELQKALNIAPGFAEARLLRAARLVRTGQFETAVEETSAVKLEYPALTWSGIVLAAAYNGLERYDDALANLAGLPGPDASSWQAMYERARAETGLGHAEAALTWSARALQSAPPSFPDAHLMRANALQIAGLWREATAEMQWYLTCPQAQSNSAEVIAAIAFTSRRATEEEARTLALR